MKTGIAAMTAVSLFITCICAGWSADLGWPKVTREMKPWTYWWWMGSAVDEDNIRRNLEDYHAVGIGGVHIIPIYCAKGWEGKYIPMLSPHWVEMVSYTVAEAGRLGMWVDMTTGTGWPFGGPHVDAAHVATMVQIDTLAVIGGARFVHTFGAGGETRRYHDDAMIRVADLPEEWEASCPYPDWIDERIFG